MRREHRLRDFGRAASNGGRCAGLPSLRQLRSARTATNLIAAQQLAYNQGFTLSPGPQRPAPLTQFRIGPSHEKNPQAAGCKPF
jgi:hypothetical protein